MNKNLILALRLKKQLVGLLALSLMLSTLACNRKKPEVKITAPPPTAEEPTPSGSREEPAQPAGSSDTSNPAADGQRASGEAMNASGTSTHDGSQDNQGSVKAEPTLDKANTTLNDPSASAGTAQTTAKLDTKNDGKNQNGSTNGETDNNTGKKNEVGTIKILKTTGEFQAELENMKMQANKVKPLTHEEIQNLYLKDLASSTGISFELEKVKSQSGYSESFFMVGTEKHPGQAGKMGEIEIQEAKQIENTLYMIKDNPEILNLYLTKNIDKVVILNPYQKSPNSEKTAGVKLSTAKRAVLFLNLETTPNEILMHLQNHEVTEDPSSEKDLGLKLILPLDSELLGAVLAKDKEAVAKALARGADINKDSFSGPPLLWAVGLKDKEFVSYLIDRGANVNIQDSEGNTPLHEAVAANSLELVRLLLSRGANAKITNKQRVTPKQLAEQKTLSDLAKLL